MSVRAPTVEVVSNIADDFESPLGHHSVCYDLWASKPRSSSCCYRRHLWIDEIHVQLHHSILWQYHEASESLVPNMTVVEQTHGYARPIAGVRNDSESIIPILDMMKYENWASDTTLVYQLKSV